MQLGARSSALGLMLSRGIPCLKMPDTFLWACTSWDKTAWHGIAWVGLGACGTSGVRLCESAACGGVPKGVDAGWANWSCTRAERVRIERSIRPVYVRPQPCSARHGQITLAAHSGGALVSESLFKGILHQRLVDSRRPRRGSC